VVAFDVGDRTGSLQFAGPFPFPEVPNLELIASADQHVQLLIEMHGADVGVGVEGSQELALFEVQAVDFVD
jgi:hypothetical protein